MIKTTQMCDPGTHWKSGHGDFCSACGATGMEIQEQVLEAASLPTEEGRKDDAGKNKLDLIDPIFTHELGRALTFGAKRYGEHNWMKGIKFSRVYGALQRHLTAWYGGETIDPDSGNHHLAHAAAMLMMLVRYDNDYIYDEFDDRKYKEPPMSFYGGEYEPELPPGELPTLGDDHVPYRCFCDACQAMRERFGDYPDPE
jgi:hypothetical protein